MVDTALARLAARLTPAERRAATLLAAAWLAGTLAGALDLDGGLARWAERRLHPPLPSPAELAARLPPGDPRPAWYVAGLALRAERARADSAPAAIDPATATRADWDRLPGIGPRLAEAIVAHRAATGGLRGPEDLLEVHGIGPRTLDRVSPYVLWPPGHEDASDAVKPDLNAVDEAWLAALPGIGPKLASILVRERQRRSGFRDWPEVLRIDGIGATRLRVLQNATRLAGARPAAGVADTSRERT
jgi:competence ComEA-like helix-hairpin-helix protein